MRASARVKGVTLLILLITVAAIWYAAARADTRARLTVAHFALGKGSATFIEAPSGRKALIDGGPDASVLRALGDAMPFYDRSLDLVIAATPDQNHVAGLIDVLERYDIGMLLQPGGVGSSPTWDLFEKDAAQKQAKGMRIMTIHRGAVYDLGDGALQEVLYPDRLVAGANVSERCVVARLAYGNTSFLFACDASAGVQKYLGMLDGTALKADVLIMDATPSRSLSGYAAASYVASSTETFISDGRTVSVK